MGSMTYRQFRHGFTLIEMLIIIVVLAIMALIVIPHFQGATRRSQESALRANLVQLRKAIEVFQSDTGSPPAVLQDLVAPTGAQLVGSYSDPNVTKLYQGPYLTNGDSIQIPNYSGVPVNPFVAPDDATVADH